MPPDFFVETPNGFILRGAVGFTLDRRLTIGGRDASEVAITRYGECFRETAGGDSRPCGAANLTLEFTRN